MKQYQGKSVYSGTAIGPVKVISKRELTVTDSKIQDISQELQRLQRAVETSLAQLDDLYEKAVLEAGEETAEILQAHKMLIEDEEFLGTVTGLIESEGFNAEYAVRQTEEQLVEMFSAIKDDYLRERAADVRDISDRVLRNLFGAVTDYSLQEPSIVVAEDLTPSETVSMDKSKILAFVTEKGSTNSHTAILARMMGIPALVQVPLDFAEIRDGMQVIVYGDKGIAIFEPDEETVAEAKRQLEEETAAKELLESIRGKKIFTKTGRQIELAANIGNPEDVESALKCDAEGIGLFRSEFLFFGRDSAPTEEEQFKAYKAALEGMGGRRVVIRTMDIGADKRVEYLGLAEEENPALGLRAIRICLTQPEIFRTQIRALLRASVYGKLAIMYPMITSCEEVKEILSFVDAVQEELISEGFEVGAFEQGIMIETPAAAIISDQLAKLVDFFSVGTNDLTQYTLAVDRQGLELERFCNPYHEAVLRLLSFASENAHKEGKWIGICGELGADTSMAEKFLKMEIDELSMSPPSILGMRKRLLELTK